MRNIYYIKISFYFNLFMIKLSIKTSSDNFGKKYKYIDLILYLEFYCKN